MDEFGSKINLIVHEDGGYLRAKHAGVITSPKNLMSSNRKSSNRGFQKSQTNGACSRACFLFVGFTTFAFMMTILCIAVFYIERLHVQLDALEQRVQILEGKAKGKQPCQKGADNVDEDEIVENRIRNRRDNNDEGALDDNELMANIRKYIWQRNKRSLEESDHIKNKHHGISSPHIAMIYGNATLLEEAIREDPTSPLHFRTYSRRHMGCQEGFEQMINEHHDYWCKPTAPGSVTTMKLTKDNHMYRYFMKAAWMNTHRAMQKYNLTNDGEIIVYTPGIYIVHASVHFTDIRHGDFPHFGVYRRNELGGDAKLISKCMVSIDNSTIQARGTGVYPCQAWQLTHLDAGSRISLSIGGYTWFRIEHETFHLALIKLNSEDLWAR